jgi:hypothetical protein
VARHILAKALGSWSVAVVLATGCAACAMVATAAVSVLSDEQLIEEPDDCSFAARARRGGGGGMRAVRAVDAEAVESVPFPDTCYVREMQHQESRLLESLGTFRQWFPTLRPLHETVELPDNFI